MVPTSIAAVLTIAVLVTACLFGIILGAVASGLLRLPWRKKVALIDAAIAAAAAVITAVVGASITMTHGLLRSGVSWIYAAVALAITIRYLLRYVFRNSS